MGVCVCARCVGGCVCMKDSVDGYACRWVGVAVSADSVD